MGNVIIIGSLSIDTIAQVEAFPQPGEHLIPAQVVTRFGGKGGNQAMAALRQGADVLMVGAVGNDRAGKETIAQLRQHNIRADGIYVREGLATGSSMVCVNAKGEHTMLLNLAANDTLTAQEMHDQLPWISMSNVMLAQFEVPVEAVAEALKIAKPLGTVTCLNPSPWREGFPWGEVELDFVIASESEAGKLLGRPVLSLGDIGWIREKTKELGIITLIVTRGEESTLAFSSSGPSFEVPTMSVQAVDTVGASDCFAGVFAARWAESGMLEVALRAASVAAALATTKPGAQESIPDRDTTDQALAAALRELMLGS